MSMDMDAVPTVEDIPGTFVCAGCGREFTLISASMWDGEGETPWHPAGHVWCQRCATKEADNDER